MIYPIAYNEPLFRPPSEAYSLILQPTIGCSWNKCAFCEMYKSKQFEIRNIDEIFREIEKVADQNNSIRKVFLADGNAMILSTSHLLKILNYLKSKLPKLVRVSTYASARDLKDKSVSELEELKSAGLKLIYTGIESGDDTVLKMVKKGESYKSTLNNLLKAREAGIKNSVMILNGLGGRNYWKQHAIQSANILNELQPEYLSTLMLSFPYGIEHFQQQFKGDYEPMTIAGLLRELSLMISGTNLNQVIFRSDHVSNYLVLKGVLSRDKERMLKEIDQAISYVENNSIKDNHFKGL